MNEATREYIRQHAHDDVRQLALQGKRSVGEVDLTFALEQIAGRQTAERKLPSWAAVDGVVYPPHLSMEQCSSEATAAYKAEVAGRGGLMVDLTGGFGVDFAWMSRGFQRAVYVERQPSLCELAAQNFRLLGVEAETVCADGMEYLHTLDHADLIFIDPARRDEHGARTYGIADCTPNVLEAMDELMDKTDRLLLKLSPMLDWRKAVEEVMSDKSGVRTDQFWVSSVHIVSVENECKELLVLVEGGRGEETGVRSQETGGGSQERGVRRLESGDRSQESGVRSQETGVRSQETGEMFRVVCVNLLSDGSMEYFEYSPNSCLPSPASFLLTPDSCLLTPDSSPKATYLLVPNASIMKAGCFTLLEERYGIRQVGQNSHLFVSDTAISEFPGRQFCIERVTSLNKRELREAMAGVTKANISVRNFPMSVAELRKRLRLQDGGDLYIFATTVANHGHQLFVCRKKS